MNGPFTDPNWNTKVIKTVSNIKFDSDKSFTIRDLTESDYNIVINFTGSNNIDSQFTAVSVYQGAIASWSAKGSAVSSSRSLIKAV